MSTYYYTHFATQMLGTLGAGLSNFPWLSASILFPIVSAFVIPFFPDKGDGKEVRWFALSIALVTLGSGEGLKYFETGRAQFYALIVFGGVILLVAIFGFQSPQVT